MKNFLKRVGGVLGASGRAFVALVGVAGITVAVANYNMTQGVGTPFGSVVVGGVHYAQQFICDYVTPAQCANVSAAGAVKVDNSAVTQPVSAVSWPLPTGAFPAGGSIGNTAFGATQSGAWNITNITGSVTLPSGASTSANQATAIAALGTNTLTTPHTCSVVGYSIAGCLGSIFDTLSGPVPVNVNGTPTAQTGLTPGTPQTGTIVAANVDTTSIGGTAVSRNAGAADNGTQRTSAAFNNVAYLTPTPLSFAASGDNTVITRTTGTIKVYGMFFTCAAPVTVNIKNGAGTSLTNGMPLVSTFMLPIQSEPYFVTTSTNNLVINLGVAGQCSGTAYSKET